MLKNRLFCIVLLSLISIHLGYSFQLPGKSKQENQEEPTTEAKEDEFGRTTPKGTVGGIIKAFENEDYERASKYVDPTIIQKNDNQFDTIGIQHFQKVLNQYGSINPLSIISGEPNGNEDEGIDLNLERIGTITTNQDEHPILLERIGEEEGQKVWVISKESFAFAQNISVKEDETFLLDDYIPEVLSKKWKGAKIGVWFFGIILLIASYLICWLLTVLISQFVALVWKNYKDTSQGKFLSTLYLPIRLLLTVFVMVFLIRAFQFSIVIRQSFSSINMILLWLALFFFIWNLSDAIFYVVEKKLRNKNKTGSLSAIIFLRTSVKFVLIVVIVLIIFDAFGLDVTTGIAALGIGGIALALGAQKTVENLVGGVSVVFDQPVNVGDFCKFGDTIGTVEEIGIRSTRIRTLNRTIVTIPNADFSSRLIENYTSRDQFLFNPKIGLRYETSHDQMKFILKGLKDMLDTHNKVSPDPARVRFVDYGSDSLIVELFAYVYAEDWNGFLAVKEELNLKMAKVIEDSGSGFAFPSQTVYLSKDSGISKSVPSSKKSTD